MRFIPFTIRDRAMRTSGRESGAGDGQNVEDETVKYLDQKTKRLSPS